ncbi:MAG: ice-binding family protein, partial [Candidatus Roizmanbacteria bacterium]|nr:ice-binding family protein [Candidatus Roizmanbacteria bacterium]
AAGRTPVTTVTGDTLGGLNPTPGVYGGGALDLTGTLTLTGDANAVWIFQMASTLVTTSGRKVILIGNAKAANVFWQVGSSATINGAGGGIVAGTIISSAGATFSTAGNTVITTLNGRALGLNASVTMVNTVINVPAP